MEPTIYIFPKIDQIIKPIETDFYFDKYPSPRLIKYGFNNFNDQIDLMYLTSIPQYKAGLEIDFEQIDKIDKNYLAKFPKKIDITFAEFWEILNLFNILSTDKIIYTTHTDTIKEISNTYQKMTGQNIKHTIITDKKTKATLVINKLSNIEIDENAAAQLIINILSELLEMQNTGAIMILQIFGTQTKITTDLIYFLSSLYDSAYVVKPSVSSNLLDIKYLVLIGLKEITKISFPQYSKEMFLTSMKHEIPNIFSTVIQCINSNFIPKKYKLYFKIKSYLDTKVYEGATYQELINLQNENLNKWFRLFSDPNKISEILDDSIKKTSEHCSSFSKLEELFL